MPLMTNQLGVTKDNDYDMDRSEWVWLDLNEIAATRKHHVLR
jgi:hypothetical protein